MEKGTRESLLQLEHIMKEQSDFWDPCDQNFTSTRITPHNEKCKVEKEPLALFLCFCLLFAIIVCYELI